MFRQKKSFFDKLTGVINRPQYDESEIAAEEEVEEEEPAVEKEAQEEGSWDDDAGQLTVDVYQTPTEITVQAMVAGVRPDDLEVSINREMITIKGRRQRMQQVANDDYFFQELYWGAFARTIVLPEEIDVEMAEATEQQGLLTIRLPKVDRKKVQKLKVKAGPQKTA